MIYLILRKIFINKVIKIKLFNPPMISSHMFFKVPFISPVFPTNITVVESSSFKLQAS